jgi:putative transposase
MKRTRHTGEQMIRKLKTAEQLIAQGKTTVNTLLRSVVRLKG